MLKSIAVVAGSYLLSVVLVFATNPLLSRIFPGDFIKGRVPSNAPLLASTALFVVVSILCAYGLSRSRSLGHRFLLVLLIIELLYTVQVSFREHRLLAEPFVVVALIAAIRRVLVITAEISKVAESNEVTFRHAVWELALLTGMILVFVGSLIMLQKQTRNREP